jgi:hypothetical protein
MKWMLRCDVFTLALGIVVLSVVSCAQEEHMKSPAFDRVRAVAASPAMKQLSVAVVRIQPPGASPYDVLTPIPEVTFEQGLVREAVVGRLKKLASNLEDPAHDVDAGFQF